MMIVLLANAEMSDLSGSTWRLILLCLAVLTVVSLLMLAPIVLARRRRHRWVEAITLGSVMWGISTAGTIVGTAFAQFKWAQDRLLLIETGYYAPDNTTDAPAWPWGIWIILALGYCALVVCATIRKRVVTPPRD